jgi:hypothetical protein
MLPATVGKKQYLLAIDYATGNRLLFGAELGKYH